MSSSRRRCFKFKRSGRERKKIGSGPPTRIADASRRIYEIKESALPVGQSAGPRRGRNIGLDVDVV